MKNSRADLSARYVAALRTHLEHKLSTESPAAGRLGRAALAGGLAVLDVARIHERAVLALTASHDFAQPRSGALRLAGVFFTQVLIPLEEARRTIWESNRHLLQRNATLRRHTAALATGNRRLEREIARRKAGEVKIQQAKERYRTLFLESQVMQGKLRMLTRQIISAQEEERKEISRELHDQVVQTLVGINVELSALGRVAASAQNLRQKISHTQRLVETSVSAVHRFARELRPAVLDDLGLIPALHAYGKNLAARKKIQIKMTAFSGVEALSIARRTVLFRVAQEALNNVARHAEATAIQITISQTPQGIGMEIGDNGKSFQVKKTLLAKNNKRLGLIGMRERVEMIGGQLTIDSTPGVGTTVRVEIPLKMETKIQ